MILTSEPTIDAEFPDSDPQALNLNKQKIVWNAKDLVQTAKDGEAGSSTVARHREAFKGKSILKKKSPAGKQEEVDSMISLNQETTTPLAAQGNANNKTDSAPSLAAEPVTPHAA